MRLVQSERPGDGFGSPLWRGLSRLDGRGPASWRRRRSLDLSKPVGDSLVLELRVLLGGH